MAINRCLCWDLKQGTFVSLIVSVFCSLLGLVTVMLDQLDTNLTSFDIIYMFRTEWRMHVRFGFLAINIVMIIAHSIMFVYSLVLAITYKRMDLPKLHRALKFWVIFMVVYILVELGCSCYEYSWYGPNIWHLAYLVFLFMQWLVRLILNMCCVFAAYYRLRELHFDLLYGTKYGGLTPNSSVRNSTAVLVKNPAFDRRF